MGNKSTDKQQRFGEKRHKSGENKHKLTKKQEFFVKEYLIDLNGTQAAIRAGYSGKSADRIAIDLLSKNHVAVLIQQAMDERAAKLGISAENVLNELRCMAHYDPADIVRESVRCPEDILKLPEDVRRAIIGWGWDKLGNFTLKLSPKTPSLDLIGKHLKLFNYLGSKENPFTVDKLDDDQLVARLANLITKG